MLLNRLGRFLLVIGVLCLLVFGGSVSIQNPQVGLFLVGLLFVVLGFFWAIKGYQNPPPSPRFGLLKRLKHPKGTQNNQGKA